MVPATKKIRRSDRKIRAFLIFHFALFTVSRIKLPEGTKFGERHISQEDWGTGIRRHYTTPDGKRHKQRYPLSKYKHLLGNDAELARLVVRLNGDDPFKRRAKEVTELRHAYVSPQFLGVKNEYAPERQD